MRVGEELRKKNMNTREMKHCINREFGWRLSQAATQRRQQNLFFFIIRLVPISHSRPRPLSRSSNYFSGFVIGFYN